ncbi:Uu.00g119270.m01.CDS01 [Anthostomella pinea]|uniref:Uu.00g119270.m01.CDS01 n=1 Tax=Anthostomella pinea TaxID=933095 RepID=A0AAI8VGL8_9PEZI|nr:Uu.00g119270.m01.CDS01 [Anthostomella pinea]
MTVTPDLIASLVQKQYDELPLKRKPVVRDNGLHEWVPLSGIVAQGRDNKLYCLSLATGMKCLPSSKLSQAQGNVLHDWHAEVLAIRAFNRFVLDECKSLAQNDSQSSEFLRPRTKDELSSSPRSGDGDGDGVWHGQPFTWREDVLLHMYCSEAPCGDASMELTMASQEDATPWAIPPLTTITTPTNNSTSSPSPLPAQSKPQAPAPALPGRAFFSNLGIIRRKPSRPDAPRTLSKSCSDKLALKQCTSLLSGPTSLLVAPDNCYIHTLVLPASQHSPSGCRRAFSGEGRMGSLGAASEEKLKWQGGYSFRPFTVETTTLEFRFSKREVAARAQKTTASNLAAAWTRTGLEEATLGGVLQGRKQFDARGASFASRRRIWALAAKVAGLLGVGGVDEVRRVLGAGTYGEVKGAELLRARRRVKEVVTQQALKGWVRNSGDEDFTL